MNILAPMQDEMQNALNLVLDKHNRDADNSRLVTGFGWALILAACIAGAAAGGVVPALAVGARAAAGSGAVGGIAAGSYSGVHLVKSGLSRRDEGQRKRQDLGDSKSNPDI